MISNPFLPSPPDAAAWSEGFVKGLLNSSDKSASATVDQQSINAFLLGVEAGENAAVNGFDVGIECVSAGEPHSSEVPSIAFEGLSIGSHIAEHQLTGLLAHGLAGLFVLAIELAVGLPHRAEDPETVLPQIGSRIVDQLVAMGVGSAAFFVGAAVDPLAEGCEIKLTPMFVDQQQAIDATLSLSRDIWIVGRWRTDQANSFEVVETSNN
jgi:hypothetical protein